MSKRAKAMIDEHFGVDGISNEVLASDLAVIDKLSEIRREAKREVEESVNKKIDDALKKVKESLTTLYQVLEHRKLVLVLNPRSVQSTSSYRPFPVPGT